MNLKRLLIAVTAALSLAVSAVPMNAYAADAMVVFGSDSYESESGEEFPVGVYIDGDAPIGFYRVEISYDTKYLEYIGGATSGGDGKILFEGGADSERVSTMLRFKVLSGGNTELSVSDAAIRVGESDGENFNVTERVTVPVVLRGEDVTASTQTESETSSAEATETSSETATEDNKVSESSVTGEDSFFGSKGNYLPLFIILPVAGAIAVIIAALAAKKSKNKKRPNINSNGENQHFPKDTGHETTEDHSEEIIEVPPLSDDELPEVFVRHPVMPEMPYMISPGSDQDKPFADGIDSAGKGEPVIQVKNVSMKFRVSGTDSSGLKDYMIQKTKGRVKKKDLKALDNISFDVYKGEIVGIIGTNGSGKSTLLKIVSGALLPTEGQVIADYDKIQLLTLGTGFDGELSAKENVYLNGAIIGYTKEFIDDHYDEIVEFAELQGFMDEKVKTFSSGMVSRLGFSIATVAGAAEILILDEVLSVGDQFFRKKSVERIQQMIHGGSTVLIVSHSLGTIKSHCTKVVWIEKGKLRMVGDPKTVCEAYSNQQNEVKLNHDGVWACYKGGIFQKDFSGVERNEDGSYIMFNNGIHDKSFNMALNIDKSLLYFENGIVNEKYTGIAETKEKEIVFFKDGVHQSDFTGGVKTGDNRYMYFKNGIFDSGFDKKFEGRKYTNGISETTSSEDIR